MAYKIGTVTKLRNERLQSAYTKWKLNIFNMKENVYTAAKQIFQEIMHVN